MQYVHCNFYQDYVNIIMIAQEILKTKKCLHELDVWAITAYIKRVQKIN